VPLKVGLESAPAFLNPRFHCLRRLPTNRREWREFFSGRGGFCAGTRKEKEATEGDWGWLTKILSVDAWASGREIKVQGESIAQRSQRPQRGDWDGWPKFYRWHRGRLCEKSVQQKSIAQRSQRPQRGDWGGWPKFYRCQPGCLGEKLSPRGKHCTEVAEGDWVWWSKILSATAWASGPELIKRNGQSLVESRSGVRSMPKCKSPHRKEGKTWRLMRLGATMSPNECLATHRKSLCGLRDLRAMLSLGS
jgi:hypothetical protein